MNRKYSTREPTINKNSLWVMSSVSKKEAIVKSMNAQSSKVTPIKASSFPPIFSKTPETYRPITPLATKSKGQDNTRLQPPNRTM